MRRWPLYTVIAVAVIIAVVVAATAALHLWWLGAAMAAAAVAGYLSSSIADRRRLRADPGYAAQERVIRQPWKTARGLPAGTVITDPLTGSSLGTERASGFLTLVVAEPPASALPGQADAAIVHRYMLGFAGRPIRPPLFHDVTSAHNPPQRMTKRQLMDALQLAEQTGVADTDPMELAGLIIQLHRAMATRRDAT
jgi:hypothetical protein